MILARVRFVFKTIRRRRMDLVPCSKYHCLLLLVPLQKCLRHVLYPLQSVDRRRGHRCSSPHSTVIIQLHTLPLTLTLQSQ